MDRHVLLKMLKPGVPVAHEYFSREISTVVRLDGEGVLRAIDEGTVKGVRYLVVDEAEGIPLSASSVGGEEGWASLTRTALELWRRVLERECILLPIPAVSWRRLPAGDFASADLGWLVPIGQKIPTHPWLDAEITARESRPQDAIASFDATGKALAEALGIPLPAAWRRASQSLASVAADAQFEDVLRAFIDAKAIRLTTQQACWRLSAGLPATREVLETQGVPVLGYQTDEMPAFFARSSGLAVDTRVDSAETASEQCLGAAWVSGVLAS